MKIMKLLNTDIKKMWKFQSVVILILSNIFVTLNAQKSGTIVGTILDNETGQAIPFANIIIKGTLIGTTSDLNGNFKIKNINPGNYDLQVLHLGYELYNENLTIKSNDVITLTVKLKPISIEMQEVIIAAERPKSAASSKEIKNIDLETQQNRSSQDLLLRVPGLMITQHQGGGKAEQILIRGFDCDHGTDINISADGIPVNMVTNAHGQGYADAHFLIAETIDDIEVYKGPYFVEFGDFATAASVVFKTKDFLENNQIRLEGGNFNTYKATLLYQLKETNAQQNAYFAGQYFTSDGPFENPQNFKRLNIFAKYFNLLSYKSKITFSFSSYTSCWDASGQIPERAVKQGIISRFGAIDNMEGGTTGRQNFNMEYTLKGDENDLFTVQSYFSKYNFKLFSNFTFYLLDSVNGDMIEQKENRDIYGVNIKYQFYKSYKNMVFKTTFGGGFRADNINVGLWHSPNRIRMHTYNDVVDYQRNFYLYASEDINFSSKFKANFGLRTDYFTFNVDDNTPLDTLEADSVYANLPHASGYDHKFLMLPKFNLIYSPSKNVNIFFNNGIGFHSNDARNVIIGKNINNLVEYYKSQNYSSTQIDSILMSKNFDPEQKNVTTIPICIGNEVGITTNFKNKFYLSAALWHLYLEKEYVYAGDGGFTELSDATRRIGVDAEFRYRIFKSIWLYSNFSYADARVIGVNKGSNYVPLSPKIISSYGINIIDIKGLTMNFYGRYVSDRPGNEDYSLVAPGHLIFNAGLSYKFKQFQFFLFVENIFNKDWNEAQFATETRLKNELYPVTEICFTPGNPRNFQAGVSFNF